MGITFPVHDVEPLNEILPTTTAKDSLVELLRLSPYDKSWQPPRIVAGTGLDEEVLKVPASNALIGAVHIAFSQHRSLSLSPDMIWLTIAQGFALHIRNHAELLRKAFVSHEGRKQLVIGRDDIDPAGDLSHAPWPEVIQEFAELIQKEVGPIGEVVLSDFSTTGPIERVASQVVLLDAFEPYFQCVMICICGIPSITLEGTPEDWVKLRGKVECLRSYDCDWWVNELMPICQQFINASRGEVDTTFWRQIYKLTERYGGEDVEGWIGKLFPYIPDDISQRYDVKNPLFAGEKVRTSVFPNGLSQVPVKLVHKVTGAERSIHFLAGLVGITFDHGTNRVRPQIGWAITETERILQLLPKLKSPEHSMHPPRADLKEPEINPSGYQTPPPYRSFPVDLQRFYEVCDGGRLHGGTYEFPGVKELERSRLFGGWQFCKVLSGALIAWNGENVIYNAADAPPHHRVVIARSFTEFLERALASPDQPFFEKYDFMDYGEPGMRIFPQE